MKIKEVLFIIISLAVGFQAATYYSLVDTQNDENISEDSETQEVVTVNLKLDTIADKKEEIPEVLIDRIRPEIDDSEDTTNFKLKMLELQNDAIRKQFNDLTEKNRKLQERLDEKRNKHHEAKRQKPARVQLEANSQSHDNNEDWGFWNWLCHVAKNVARGVLNFLGIHI